jgi:hypothetical protein
MQVDDVDLGDTIATADLDSERAIVPMARPESIASLRDKLHLRMAALRRGGKAGGEAGDKDELLEERRRQRAALREKRRKETRERRRAETEGKKGSKKDSKGVPVKVRFYNLRISALVSSPPFSMNRVNCLSQTTRPLRKVLRDLGIQKVH